MIKFDKNNGVVNLQIPAELVVLNCISWYTNNAKQNKTSKNKSKKFTGINEGPDKDSFLHRGASTTASTDIATTHDDKSPVKNKC